MDDLVRKLIEASRILNEAPVPEASFLFVSHRTYKMMTDRRYRGRMIRKGKVTKKEANRCASLP